MGGDLSGFESTSFRRVLPPKCVSTQTPLLKQDFSLHSSLKVTRSGSHSNAFLSRGLALGKGAAPLSLSLSFSFSPSGLLQQCSPLSLFLSLSRSLSLASLSLSLSRSLALSLSRSLALSLSRLVALSQRVSLSGSLTLACWLCQVVSLSSGPNLPQPPCDGLEQLEQSIHAGALHEFTHSTRNSLRTMIVFAIIFRKCPQYCWGFHDQL